MIYLCKTLRYWLVYTAFVCRDCQYRSIGNTDEALVSSVQKQVYFYIKIVAGEYKI